MLWCYDLVHEGLVFRDEGLGFWGSGLRDFNLLKISISGVEHRLLNGHRVRISVQH